MRTKPSIYLRWQGYYDYNKENVQKFVLETPYFAGVYKIAELQTFGRLVPFYVDESDNLFKTLIGYFKLNNKNKCLQKRIEDRKCSFRFASISKKEEREAVVYTLYQHYHPVCNNSKKIPKSYIVNINPH